QPKTSFKNQLRVLILDLYVAWLEDPELSIGMSMSPNEWKANSRYNALHLSKKLIPITEALSIAGLVDLAKGSYAGPGAKSNRITRIRASEGLQDMFRAARFRREDVHHFEGQEIIILRDEKVAGKVGKEVEYTDNPNTNAMRDELKAYNDLLAASFIDIATLQEPIIQRDDDEVTAPPLHIHRDHARLRRVFSRKDWSMNGRFYGGWWQQVNEDWRSKIFIDDQPTVEVDFKGLHVAMLYAQAGAEMKHDPYAVSEEDFKAYPPDLLRKLVKRLALTAINAKEKSAAYRAFRDGFPGGHVGKTLSDKKLDQLLASFLEVNPVLEEFLFSDQGIRLMYLDSQITAHIHSHFTQQGVPVLSIHDSYIIDHMRVAELRDVMAEASKAVVGQALPTSIKLPDMPEYSYVSDERLQEDIENRKGIRCVGYMDRLFTYQERTGRSISPVARGDAEMDHRLGLLG
ncbi:hypothetical protein, partial [Leisingera sp. MMG026]|uniref:hypothetical protein n=1 Tax=Leisingera sp. MMG026 TaxID=2909982 RepID=UPI001F1E531C